MTTDTSRSGSDTYVSSARPNEKFHRANVVRLKGSDSYGFVQFKVPAPPKATIVTAFLEYEVAENATGSFTVSARRVEAPTFQEGVPDPVTRQIEKMTWGNKPPLTGTTVSAAALLNPRKGDVIRIPVGSHVQGFTQGGGNYGWRISSDNNTALFLRSLDASGGRPRLVVHWNKAPLAPTDVSPSGGGYIATGKPPVRCDFLDRIGDTTLAAMRVQLDTAETFDSAGLYDTQWVDVTKPLLNLAETTYPGLANLAITNMRVAVRDGAGQESAWSDPVTWSRADLGTLVITNPGSGGTVGEFTPTVTWTFTPPSGRVQTHWQVRVFAVAGNPNGGDRLIYDSGKEPGADASHEIPRQLLQLSTNYLLEVRAWDNLDEREEVAGFPIYAVASRAFTVVPVAAGTPVNTLAATQVGESPWIALTWKRTAVPDSFTILRDGKAIETGLDSGLVFLGGGNYRWVDYSARPGIPHTYSVYAETNGALSTVATVTSTADNVVGIWLVDLLTGDDVVLGGKDYSSSREDAATVLQVVGSGEVVRVVTTIAGRTGGCSNLMLRTRNGLSWETYEARLQAWADRPSDTFRLVIGPMNMAVVLGNIDTFTHPDSREEQVLLTAKFDWWEDVTRGARRIRVA